MLLNFCEVVLFNFCEGGVWDAEDWDKELEGQGHLWEGQDRRQAHEGGTHHHRKESG